ncbi:unnamed protein product [Acanthoscelides obtectus]|nr:unnamed protein product [Acanthoscelides obtectus]CAK1675093.1 Zinc finger protein 425 [Acanthoscelides obtectus]
MKPKTDLESDDKPFIKSEETYPDYVADCDSIMNQNGVNQLKLENQLVVEVKSEEPTVNSTKLENGMNEEFDIKSEYDEDALSVLKWDRIKVEDILEPGIEADWTPDTVNQMKMGFQKLEEKTHIVSTNFANTDALGLHEEFDVKTECDQKDRHDSATNSAQIKGRWKREQTCSHMEEGKKLPSCYICDYMSHCKKGLIDHIKSNNSHLGSNLEKSWSVFKKKDRLDKCWCTKCSEVFKTKRLLDSHVIRKHAESIALISSKIHECTLCDFKTVHKSHITRHMLRHAAVSDLHICKHCSASFKREHSLFDHILKKHPSFSRTICSKIYECMHCALKRTTRNNFIKHVAKHDARKTFKCLDCDASFKDKLRLENHILQKHSEFAVSVSSKVHECTHCEFKTTYARSLAVHMMKHTGAKYTCINCDAQFRTKPGLDNHILQKHCESSASVSSKIHTCKHCEYKTTHLQQLTTHMMKHTGVKLTCTKCDAAFTTKQCLDNHTLQKHPEFTATVSHKIHECMHCEYRTTHMQRLNMHMMKHTGAKLGCTKCDASFIKKLSLDNHILQKHPEFISSISHKIHKCTHCEYKTTHGYSLATHLRKHTAANLTCTKCDASFTGKQSLDNHTLQKHPESTASVSSKIHQCIHCEFKTTQKGKFTNHVRKHSQS